MYEHIQSNTWPTPKQIRDFGDNWHCLPIIKCFDIPDMIDPSLIYSDKSHSTNRKEVLSHIKTNPNVPIPTKKFLEIFLKKPSTDWKEFLKEVNDQGLQEDDLIIGLKGKENQIKRKVLYINLMASQRIFRRNRILN